jgi:hypothetical protein
VSDGNETVWIGHHLPAHRARLYHTDPDCYTVGPGNNVRPVDRAAIPAETPHCKACAGAEAPGGPVPAVDGIDIRTVDPEDAGLPPRGERS